jgi:tRNA(fMet)-specific endonuclease VapC
VNYLLDTNACIALINGDPERVRKRFEHATATGSQVFVPSVVAFELWYGVAKSTREEFNTRRLRTFLAGPVSVLPFEEADARAAGSVRAALEVSGKPIGAYDVLIAGQAIHRQLTLVTANVAEFSRVRGLVWQDWAKP